MPLARALLVSALVTVSFALMTTGARAADSTLQVVPIGLGTVHVDQAPEQQRNTDSADCNHGKGTDQDFASNRDDVSGECTLTYPAGTVVTLTATGSDDFDGVASDDGPPTTFRRWSDDRCPSANSCTLTIGVGAQTVSALFSPQRVSVSAEGDPGGSVTSSVGELSQQGTPGCDTSSGLNCVVDVDPDLATPVVLTAGPDPKWATDPLRLLCDSIAPDQSTCSITPAWPRWASVGTGSFDAPGSPKPPDISVRFHVAKSGGGSGTVRGGLLDCGTECAATQSFGAPETLQAIADSGSRFVGWRGACGSSPTCRLAIGPVTAVTAVFERAVSQNGPTTGPTPTPTPRKSRLVKLNVRGHGRKRAILMRVELGGPASVRARLLRGRRQVTARRWQLKAGSYLLRMNVPARVRPGRYRVALTVSGGGQTQQITRPVRLRR
jgi:List-Bact-rpt repeat protein